MEMIQFLETDKEQLYGSITQAGTPEQVEEERRLLYVAMTKGTRQAPAAL